MSRSYRKPFAFIVCCSGMKQDRQIAARMVRRRHKQQITKTHDFENFLLAHRLECRHNDRWGWNSDGGPQYHREMDTWYLANYFATVDDPPNSRGFKWSDWYLEMLESHRKYHLKIQRK